MPIEDPPKNPLPADFVPANSTPYRVKDGDDWTNVAQRHGLDVQELIRFNFHTNKSNEVNWYLRRNVGCNVPDGRRLNWKFSSSARPGIIYLPLVKMSPFRVTGRKTRSPMALEFEGPAGPLDKAGKVFDIVTVADMGLAILGVGALDLLMIPAGAVAATFGPIVAVGGAHEAALNKLRTDQMKEGLSLGLVLAADRQDQYRPNFTRRFVKRNPVRHVLYQEYGKQLQGLFNSSLIAGIAHGRQFSTVAQKRLFDDLRSRMTDYAKAEYEPHADDPEHPDNFRKWGDRKWEDYYRLCAAIYAKHHLIAR